MSFILQTRGMVNCATVKEANELFPKCKVFPVKHWKTFKTC